MDTTHKAGKQLLKEIPNFYAANPEFRGKKKNEAREMEPAVTVAPSKKKKTTIATEVTPVEESKIAVNSEQDKQKRLERL